MYSKEFFDLACGGTREAKAQATAWRDAQLAELKALTLVEFHQQKRSNNLSGVPGVHFHKTVAQDQGGEDDNLRRTGVVGSNSYFIDHTAFIYLIDQEGRYVSFLPPGTTPERMQVMVREALTRIVKSGAVSRESR